MDEDTGLVRSALGYPLAGDGARSRLLMGAGLHFVGGIGVAVALAVVLLGLVDPILSVIVGVGIALLGYVPLLGYTAATMRSLLEDEDEPPTVADWSALLRDGRRAASIVALYAAPAVALATVAIALGGVGSQATTLSLGAAGLSAVLALLALYVLPAALATVVESGETAAAWDGGTLADAVQDGRYLKAWLVGAGASAVGAAVGTPLAVVLVGLPVLFATQLAVVNAATRGVVDALEWTLEEPPAPPASGYIPEWEDGSRRKELTDGRLGGSLLPTTPGSDDGPAASDDGVDPNAGAPGDSGAAAAGSDITPFVEGDGEMERVDEEE